MLGSSRMFTKILSSRSFSGLAADHPRMKIAKGILKINAIRGATNEKSLTDAVKNQYAIDIDNLPKDLESMKEYLSVAPAASTYAKDNSHWHNKSFFEAVQIEASRDEAWPFLAAALVFHVGLVLLFSNTFGVKVNSPELESKSGYLKLKNGTYFDHEFGLHHSSDHGHGHESAHGH